MNDEEIQALLKQSGAEYRVPPDPPLDRMWEHIEARVFGAEVIPLRPRRKWMQPLAYAATLGFGVAVGLLAGRLSQPGNAPQPDRLADQRRGDIALASATPFVGLANDYLEKATALLIAIGSDLGAGGIPAATIERARDLLSTTRLLLDTAPGDQSLHALLEDLELVLAQVVRLPENPTAPDAALIHQTLDQRDVLPRLTVLLADARISP